MKSFQTLSLDLMLRFKAIRKWPIERLVNRNFGKPFDLQCSKFNIVETLFYCTAVYS